MKNTPTNIDDELREKCQRMQTLMQMDDKDWKSVWGNKGGLYGFIQSNRKKYELDARLVELDLLEQAINREEYGLTLDATRYKMLRLNDIKKRMAEPKAEREKL